MSYIKKAYSFIKSVPGSLKPWLENLKNQKVFNAIKASKIYASKKLRYASLSIFIGIVAVVLFIFLQKYSLNPNVKSALDLIPEDASLYIEIKNVAKFKSDFEKSDLGKEINDNPAWNNLIGGYDSSLNTVVYFLGVKSGISGSYSDFFSFVDGNTGLAFFPDKSWLSVTRSNIKSRLGAALVSAFKAEKVKLKPEVKKEIPKDPGQNSNEAETGMFGENQKIEYSDAFSEETIPLSNLQASRIYIREKPVYFVLLENYLFISNNLEKLTQSLELATSPGEGLNALKGFEQVNKDYQKEETQSIVYFNNMTSLAAPMLHTLGESAGTAFCFKFSPKETVEANIYLIENEPGKATIADKGVSWEKEIPADFSLVYFSRSKNLHHIFESFKTLNKDWDPLKKGMENFLTAGQLDVSGELDKTKGISFVMHDLRRVNKKIVPDFSVLFHSPAENNSLTRALFKPGNPEKHFFQNTSYTTQEIDNGFYYHPSHLYSGNIEIQSSSNVELEKFISTGKGNAPALSDANSYKRLGQHKDADFHLVLNVGKFIHNILEFYSYGEILDNQYTEKTLEKDIKPLFTPFLKYKFVHMAISGNLEPNGKLVVTEN